MRSGQHWSMIIKQAMDANKKELDPSDQELEGRIIAGEISSVNHRTPCPSAPPIEGRLSKREIDKRYNMNRKKNEDIIMKAAESLEKIYGELERENDRLKWQENQLEVNADEEYGNIVSWLEDNNAGQNTDVQGASAYADFPIANADINTILQFNTIGEISMGHDGLKREMNQAPITSNAGTFSRESASMNVQLVGSSGLTDKREKKRIADKKCREKKKGKMIQAENTIKELRIKYPKLLLQNVRLKEKATQLQKRSAQHRNIKKLMTSRNERIIALLVQVLSGHLLQNTGQGSTSFNPQLQLLLKLIGFGTRETMLHVHQPPVYQSGTTMGSGGPTIEESLGLPQSHLLQGWEHGSTSFNPQLQLTFEMTEFGTGPTGLPIHQPPVYQSGTTMGSRGPTIEESLGLPQSHLLQGWEHGSTSFNPQLQLPFEMTEFGIGPTGLPIHQPPVYQSGTTMGSRGPAIEESLGLPQSHLLQGRTHSQLPSGMTPNNTFSTGEAGLPAHHPPDYQYRTTMGSGGPTIENPMGLPQSHVSQGWAHGNQGQELDEETQELETKRS